MYDATIVAGLVGVFAISAWLSAIDIKEHKLPNRLVGPLAVGVAAWLVVLGVVQGDLSRTATAVAWGLGAVAVFFALHVVANLGMGDVKYAWPVGATLGWFGWDSVRIAILAMCLTGGLVAFGLRRRSPDGSPRIAFGPFMAIGLAAGIARAAFS